MPYKGFTCNLLAGDAELIMLLLIRYRTGRPVTGIDDRLAERYIHMLMEFLEVSPDGSTPTHATADA